jgi:uncharacterized membrane protein YdfJ with MMPL/SSD domain
MTRISAAVVRNPWRVVIGAALLAIVAAILGGRVQEMLSPGGFTDPGSQSQVALRRIAAAANVSPDQSVIAMVSPTSAATSAAGAAEVAAVRVRLAADPAIATVTAAPPTSRDGRRAYVVAALRPMSDRDARDVAERLEASFAADPRVTLGGFVISNQQVQAQVTHDLGRAEVIAAVVLTPLLMLVFRSAVAALLPLMVGVLTILTTFLGLRIVNSATDLSVFALNLVTGLGLGLAIDYSLIMVSRYREEAQARGHGAAAVRATLATAGRTVVFSALTVAAALASLLVFPQQFLYSMGIGGVLVTLTAASVAVTLVPSVLLLLGRRIDMLPLRRVRTDTAERSRWYRLSHAVMRRPAAVAVAATAILLVAGVPFLGVRFTSIDSGVLPVGASARQVDDAARGDLPPGMTSPITVAVSAPARARAAVTALGATIGRLPDVVVTTPPRYLGAGTWTLAAIAATPPLDRASLDLVAAIDSLPGPGPVRTAGQTAQFADLRASLGRHLPLAILIVALVTVVVLFALTGSVVLPAIAVVMNALSLSAAFGLLVLIFQDGRFTGPLDYTGQGALESTQPVLLFAMAFGLSTDYGVFLLARIKEARDRGLATREAIAEGLERMGRLVTAAAALFCVAIGVFATSSIVFIKELGVGTALAVIVDATIVRALLVPSLLALVGDRGWWAPQPLRGLRARLRLDRLEGQSAGA